MPLLSAKFVIPMTAPCLTDWPQAQDVEVTVKNGDFDARVRLVPERAGVPQHQQTCIRRLTALEIMVTRNETDAPPDVVIADGRENATAQMSYLRERLPAYGDTAVLVVNRLLEYFRYRLRTPLTYPVQGWEQALHNPTWYDANNQRLRGYTLTIVVRPIPTAIGKLKSGKLDQTNLSELQSYLAQPVEVSLAEELMSDAQSAWYEGNLRRAVLELAICVELVVKRRLFAEGSAAGAAFDYLEDKSRVSVRVLELIDTVSFEAFSHSYRKEHPSDYDHIDRLFRCRNKIAHRAELAYRDDSGKSHKVGKSQVEEWWLSAAHLMNWLKGIA
jgi:hypothetical protein